MIKTSCHCGDVTISIDKLPDDVTSCNCSICSKFAALWAHFSPNDAQIISKDGALASYTWGDKCIKFHHCKNCGCVTHYTPTELGNSNKMAVNFRLFEVKLINTMTVRHFDGADSWSYLD